MINSTLYMLPRHIAPKMLVCIKKKCTSVSYFINIFITIVGMVFNITIFVMCQRSNRNKEKLPQDLTFENISISTRILKIWPETDRISGFSGFRRYLWFVLYIMDINFSICFALKKYRYLKNMLIFSDIYNNYGYIFLLYLIKII